VAIAVGGGGVRSGSGIAGGVDISLGGGLDDVLISGSGVFHNWGSGVVDIDDGSGGVVEINSAGVMGWGVGGVGSWHGSSVRAGLVGIAAGVSLSNGCSSKMLR
jgi:hypothetical protein